MKNIAEDIQVILQRKLDCYQRLVDVFEEEKGYISAINLEGLWRTTKSKKELAAELKSLREQLLDLFNTVVRGVDMDRKSFSLAYLLKALPVPPGLKAGLQRVKEKINTAKKQVVQMGRMNREQVEKHLKVVDDVMGILADNSSQAQYTLAGRIPGARKTHCLIRAEV